MPDPPSMSLSFLEPFDHTDPPTSWTSRSGKYPKKIESLALGASADSNVILKAFEYGGIQTVGSGSGGDFIIPQIVLNTVNPTGVLHHNKWWEITVGLREDEYLALFDTPVSDSLNAVIMDGENAPIGYLQLIVKYADGALTITFGSGSAYLAGVAPGKTTTEDGKYTVELKFVCIGDYTAFAFLEPFDYRLPVQGNVFFLDPFDHIEPSQGSSLFTEPFDS